MHVREVWERWWPPLLAVTTVTAVGVPAAVASYLHARTVVARSGDPAMAPWLPLSVDGMLLAALVVIWVRRRRGQPAGVFPWVSFGLGMAATIAANLAAADRTPEGYVVALWPPVALAITLELVALVAHRETSPGATVADLVASLPAPATLPGTAPDDAPDLFPAGLPAAFPVEAPGAAHSVVPTPLTDASRDSRDAVDLHVPTTDVIRVDDRDPVEWAREQTPPAGRERIAREFPHLTETQSREAAREAKSPASRTPLRRVQ